jgi:hypothetical protein
MHQADGVCSVQRARDLLDEGDDERQIEPPALLQQRGEGLAGHQAHREEQSTGVLSRPVDRHHVGVFQRRRQPPFALEPRAEDRVRRGGRRDHLERHQPVEPLVAGAVDHAHPACTDQRLHDVLAEDVAGAQWR